MVTISTRQMVLSLSRPFFPLKKSLKQKLHKKRIEIKENGGIIEKKSDSRRERKRALDNWKAPLFTNALVPFKSEKFFKKEWSHFRFKKEEDVLHFVQLLLLRWKFFFFKFYLTMKWIPFSNVRNRGAYRRCNRQKSIWLNREPRIMSTYDLACGCV